MQGSSFGSFGTRRNDGLRRESQITALPASVARNLALPSLASRTSCEDCPVWGAIILTKSKKKPPAVSNYSMASGHISLTLCRSRLRNEINFRTFQLISLRRQNFLPRLGRITFPEPIQGSRNPQAAYSWR